MVDLNLVRKHIERIKPLLLGEATVKSHTRRSKTGKSVTVKQHERKLPTMSQINRMTPAEKKEKAAALGLSVGTMLRQVKSAHRKKLSKAGAKSTAKHKARQAALKKALKKGQRKPSGRWGFNPFGGS